MSVPVLHRIRRSASVAWLLALREWRADLRQSRLSVLWPLLHPLAYTLLLVSLRSLLGSLNSNRVDFALFVFIGFSLWQTWFEMLKTQMDAIRRHKALVSRGELRTPSLCLATTFTSAIQLAPRLVVMVIGSLAIAKADAVALLSLVAFSLMVLLNGSVLGAVLQPFAALSSDLSKFIQSISLALVLSGAVFLPLPPTPSPFVQTLIGINPMGALLNAARAPILGHAMVAPGAVGAWCIVTVLLGLAIPRVGRRTLPLVIERMGG